MKEGIKGILRIKPENVCVGVIDEFCGKLPDSGLGGIQSVKYYAHIGGYNTCHIETVMSDVELLAFEENTNLKVKVEVEHPCWFCHLKYQIKKLISKKSK